jgi:hypothetical protein
MLFYICLNIAAYILNASGALMVSQELYINPLDISNRFSLTIFVGLTVAGGLTGIIALITRQYVFASVALVIWAVGLLVPIGQWFLLGVPIIMNAIVPSELSYLTYAVSAFMAFIFFMFMMEILTQRQIT